MTAKEREEMLEKLISEGMSPEEAEKAVAEAAAAAEGADETNDPSETDEDNRVDNDHGSSDGANDHNPDEPDETVSEPGEDSNETFPRAYVEKLRRSEAKYRERAQQSEELAKRLQVALVKLDGRLADPEDLPFDWALLEDPDALAAAIADLVKRKPGLKAQQLGGDVGHGRRGGGGKPQADLISIIKGL